MREMYLWRCEGWRAKCFALIVVFCLLLPALAFAWEATVVKIHDGDTITVRVISDGRLVKVRLWGIDCPEYQQLYGKEATEFVRKLLPIGITVSVEDKDRDRYKRIDGIVQLPDGTVAQEAILKVGLAWVYRKYCKNCGNWYALEEEARKAKRGLWRDKNPVPPWEWRKRNK